MKESKNMKIGIDISQIVYKGTGVARFTEGLTNAILDFDRLNSWVFFFSSLRRNLDQSLQKKMMDRGHKLIKWKLPPTALSFLFNDLHNFSKLFTFNPSILLRTSFSLLTSLDWFISSDWTEPPLPVNKAAIVHDLVYLRHPETVHSRVLNTQKRRLFWVKKESRIISADSNATKQDLIDLLHIDSNKIHVNYPGVEVKKPTKQQIATTLKKYNLDKPFILTVGKLEPRKNIKRLIAAFSKLNVENLDLVIAGSEGWGKDISIKHLIEISKENVKFLGYVEDLELYSLYASCLFFVFPSIWEGFGYPVVEAMRLGAPIATSNTSSLKEIVDDSALLFNPLSVSEMSQCIDTLRQDNNLRVKLSKKALERSKMFTWENYFQRMISILMSS